MRMVGANTLVVTNAVGSINPTYQVLQSMSLSRDLHKCWFQVGDIMLVCDHINMFGLAGNSPLRWRNDSFTDDYLLLFARRGPNDESFGPRFFALNGLYDIRLRELARSAAKQVVFHSSAWGWCHMKLINPPCLYNSLYVVPQRSLSLIPGGYRGHIEGGCPHHHRWTKLRKCRRYLNLIIWYKRALLFGDL